MYNVNLYEITELLPASHNKYYRQRTLNSISRVIIHHTALFNAHIKNIAKYHVENNKWPGIGYHFIINHDNKIYKTNILQSISYHCSGNNSNSIGIAFNFNYNKQLPKPESIRLSYALLYYLESQLNIKEILPHRALGKTSCPGVLFNWYNFITKYNFWKSDKSELSNFNLNIISPKSF